MDSDRQYRVEHAAWRQLCDLLHDAGIDVDDHGRGELIARATRVWGEEYRKLMPAGVVYPAYEHDKDILAKRG